jgi:preprotein translocase subunit SecY
MNVFLKKLKFIFQDKALRRRVLFVVFALVAFRLLAAIPIPGVDTARLESFLAGNEFLGLLNIFSGGGLANLSIMMLGVAPYITASIIMQLVTIMSPRLRAMYQEEGSAGRKKFSQYSRLLTAPLAIIQSFGFLAFLRAQGVLGDMTLFDQIVNVLVITAGSILLMWIGELISEFGIGNGVSIIIFAGIVAILPSNLAQLAFTFDVSQLPIYLAASAATMIIIYSVVYITEAERPVPITYAKRVRGAKVYGGISTYLPLRLNQAGVIPIIFALSILLFPQMLLNFVGSVDNELVQRISSLILAFVENGWIYSTAYFLLVFGFTYFYTAVTFDPDSTATQLQKNGAFIPGIRPGATTSGYLAKILTRLTLVGGLFLGFIAVLPLGMMAVTNITAFAVGGTSLLIAVSVVIDLVKKIDAQLSVREY